MSRLLALVALAAGLTAGIGAESVGAQGTPRACTQPLDPACNHLKCYQIKDTAITGKTPLLQVDNQFGREAIFRLQPVLLCVPSQKACCDASGSCSAANCAPNPVPAPGLPHLKCYKIKVKTCTDPTCANLGKFAKGTLVDLRDQFGPELNVAVGNPKLFCAPVEKRVVGETTTTTVTTTSSTTSTTMPCHFEPTAPTGCAGGCPATAPPGSQCQRVAPDKCDCVPPPVCCECPGPASSVCFDTTAQCPAGCAAFPDADCDSTTGSCGCGFCRDLDTCSNIPCSANQPCPGTTICDPSHCPRPCGGPCDQTGTCSPAQCFRPDGTAAECRPVAGTGCTCCGPPGTHCTGPADCCSGVCATASQSCQ